MELQEISDRIEIEGVVIRYTGTPDQIVRLPEHYEVDEEATARLRGARA